MRYLIAYDITDDRRRYRIAQTLLDYGQRLQESLFLCYLESGQLQTLRARLVSHLELTEDRLHIIPLCASCWASTEAFGRAERPEEKAFIII